MSKRLLWLPPILGILVLGLLFWRIHVLSGEVDRLAHRPDATPPTRLPEGFPPAGPAALPEPATLAARGGVGSEHVPLTSDAERVRTRIDALERELEALREAGAATSRDLGEVLEGRRLSNQLAAIATSRNLISALAQFQQSARVDENADGTGEYGGFLEMSGAVPGRMAGILSPPVLSTAFRTLTAAGEAERNGYLYRIYLPDARGLGVGESATGFARGAIDPQSASMTWCMYAWPVEHGRTGTRTFFANQGGDVLVSETARYSGSGAGPAPDAAFVERGSIIGRVAIDARGSDGNEWKQAN